MQLVREVTDIPSNLDQSVLYAVDFGLYREARSNLIFDRSEIEGRRGELLEYAVVQLSGDAGPLLLLRLHQPFVQRRGLCLVPLENSNADAVRGPEQRRRSGDTERTEPSRLVIGRSDREI